jgi:uncharacterized glyoxalase superfamily protein PhnB/catechol 2,3-dioxygenase-like lactoylglutathione lyase family enzyme
MDLKLELVVVPVTDVGRAKEFYEQKAGFHVDFDHHISDEFRLVQLTPPGSACSIMIGSGITKAKPGSVQGVQLVTRDVDAARAELVARGMDVTEVQQFDPEERTWRPLPESSPRDWGSFVFFSDPDGNRFTVQHYGGPLIENRSVPSAAVIPVLGYDDVTAAAGWICDTFGFRMRLRIGDHRAQLVYGDGAVIVTDGGGGGAGHSVHVSVEDADAHHTRASEAGAEILSPPAEYPYGERQYSAKDPGGHVWTFSQSIRDVDPADWGGELVTHQDG